MLFLLASSYYTGSVASSKTFMLVVQPGILEHSGKHEGVDRKGPYDSFAEQLINHDGRNLLISMITIVWGWSAERINEW